MKDFDYYNGRHLTYPTKPKKPVAPTKLTAENARELAQALEVFESEMSVYKDELERYRNNTNNLQQEFWDDARVELGCQSYTTSVWELCCNKAWVDGHAYGYSEVYQELTEIVEFVDQVLGGA
jgi:hypothetical protein